MSEEILKVSLQELLQTVRIKRQDGTILEASDIEAIRTCFAQIRAENSAAADALFKFINAAVEITAPTFPVELEFALNLGNPATKQ